MVLQDKVALVTGAGRRVGRAIALALAERGAAVALHCRNSRAEAEAAAAEIAARGGRARVLTADLEAIAAAEGLVAATIGAFGRIDVLVNSAAVFTRGALGEISERAWDETFAVNLKAPFFLARAAGAAMRGQGAGKIINLSDIAARRPFLNYIPYSIAKAGLEATTIALARAFAPEVQVNAIALGIVAPPEDFDRAELERLARRIPAGRIGTPEDAARATIFLCEAADFATGSTLTLDGGRLIG